MPDDLAFGGSIERNIRGIRCALAKGLNLADTLVMKVEIMVAVLCYSSCVYGLR